MTETSKVLDYAEKLCKSNGARLTDKRKQVLSVLLESKVALSAYELLEHYKIKFGDALPAMSIYRILEFLEKEQLVHKLNLANKYVACSHITSNYNHSVPQFLICKECQKVKEIHISQSTISEFQQNVKDTGFHLVSPQLEMKCICDNCLTDMP